jgi:hypothetical protein
VSRSGHLLAVDRAARNRSIVGLLFPFVQRPVKFSLVVATSSADVTVSTAEPVKRPLVAVRNVPR